MVKVNENVSRLYSLNPNVWNEVILKTPFLGSFSSVCFKLNF